MGVSLLVDTVSSHTATIGSLYASTNIAMAI